MFSFRQLIKYISGYIPGWSVVIFIGTIIEITAALILIIFPLISYLTNYILISYSSYSNLLKRGVRIALRSKVNDSLITGLRIVDSILPVGRGQRQLILGDRYTGKTSIS